MRAAEAHLGPAFLSALMLTGDFNAAECAVADAIAMSGPDITADDLVIAAATRALGHEEGADQTDSRLRLPPELGRLFLLSPTRRKCFVLRILLRFSAEVSSGMLGLTKNEFEEELWQSLQDFTFGPAPQTCPEGDHSAVRA